MFFCTFKTSSGSLNQQSKSLIFPPNCLDTESWKKKKKGGEQQQQQTRISIPTSSSHGKASSLVVLTAEQKIQFVTIQGIT